tara:strand:+ start:307 stop:546 length:240 start_codon:yes stop_codon:yes gene_type:complete
MLGLGKGRKIGAIYTNWRDKPSKLAAGKEVTKYPLTDLQKNHNVHEPIEAYDENGQRSDLPSLAQQWKQDWKRRNGSLR